LCAFKGGEWIRVTGELVEDDRIEARESMLDAYPALKKMYAADDGNTEVFYFKKGVATISSFTHEPKSSFDDMPCGQTELQEFTR